MPHKTAEARAAYNKSRPTDTRQAHQRLSELRCSERLGMSIPEYRRMLHLKYLFKVTPEWVAYKIEEQGGCAVCHTLDSGRRDWCVDHDRSCCPGRKSCGSCVRGVLCHGCNTGLGLFKDNPDSLVSAINYLKKRK